MENQIVRFENRDDVRVIKDENLGVLFCAKDVCTLLGYTNSRSALAYHCDKAGVELFYILTKGGNKKTSFITEANLYSLIIHSKLKGAKIFQQWVFEEVLPSIRKTGFYVDTTQQLTQLTPQQVHENLKDWMSSDLLDFKQTHNITGLIKSHHKLDKLEQSVIDLYTSLNVESLALETVCEYLSDYLPQEIHVAMENLDMFMILQHRRVDGKTIYHVIGESV
jgi:prophage antirepressor-like protein